MTPPNRPRRRLPLPRFSLRVLLAAFTAVAIGFPVWYRWPYEEVEVKGGVSIPSTFSRPSYRVVRTWQRQWGGGRLQHGPETIFRADGSKQYVIHYANGERHGRFEAWEPTKPETIGRYEHDRKSGTWTTDTGHSKLVENWQDGQLHGPWEFQWQGGEPQRMTFSQGKLTEVNGRPWSSPLYDAHHRRETRDESWAIDDILYSNLNSPTTHEFKDVPLSSAMYAISTEQVLGLPQEASSTPVLLDPRLPDPHLPLTCRLDGLDVKTALVLLLAKHGLVADYHYGAVWVTTPELAGPWKDPTGIDHVEVSLDPFDPSPTHYKASEDLHNALDRSVDVTTTWRTPIYPGEQALAEVIADAFGPLMIQFDTSRIAPTEAEPNRFPVVAYLKDIPFRHALAYLLFQAKCRCILEGDTLVILPPEQLP